MAEPSFNSVSTPATLLLNALCERYRELKGGSIADYQIAKTVMRVSPSTFSNWTRCLHPANQLNAVIRLMAELPAADVLKAIQALSPPR